MEISSFGAKANLTPKIRTDLSGQAKDTSLICLSHTYTPVRRLSIVRVLEEKCANCAGNIGIENTGVFEMGMILQIRPLMSDILILYVGYNTA